MSGTAPDTQKFVAIALGVPAPQIRDFDVLQGGLDFNAFLGSCNLLQLTLVNGF